MAKWIYHLKEINDTSNNLKLFGNKGFNLALIYSKKLPIPPGFIITTELYDYYYKKKYTLPPIFSLDLIKAITVLEQDTGKIFGDPSNPLLVAVRSSGLISMPGMMDTILNLGMNDAIVESMCKVCSPIFVLDSYRRFIQMYGQIVLKISSLIFEDIIDKLKILYSITNDNKNVNEEYLNDVIVKFKQAVEYHSYQKIPEDVNEQLHNAIKAILESWMNQRAVIYRKLNNISDNLGTAVTVQSMVFGNMGPTSASGVVFTRNPSTGMKELYGEFLVNAQGEDIVSGIRTPDTVSSTTNSNSLQFLMPELYNELEQVCNILECHYQDMQDIEFTIEDGKLYILQTRPGKRTAVSAIKIAVDMVDEGLITKNEAILRIDPNSLSQLLHAHIDYNRQTVILAQGLPASPGAATGVIAFNSLSAESMSKYHKVILVRTDTSPEDIRGIHASAGILTARGGITSHAAVVARGMGKPCVVGVSSMSIDIKNYTLKIGDIVLQQGEEVSIDGSNGKILLGKAPLIQPEFIQEFQRFMSWVDEFRTLEVRANAETTTDALMAIRLGAEGIGLCRTEHMFFENQRMQLIRQVILAVDQEQRKKILKDLLVLHKEDFKELFQVLKGQPINIRLLDPPLHEFLPQPGSSAYEDILKSSSINQLILDQRLDYLKEMNPMLGHRGCRLGITFPEIYEMQVQAIFEALLELKREAELSKKQGNFASPQLEVMLPFIMDKTEFVWLKNLVVQTVERIEDKLNYKFNYKIGTMIELPRAALKAHDIATEADFFSFGTNDLTQTTFGISRDDVASFLETYLENDLLSHDPFVVLDQGGVGELMKIAITRGRQKKPNLKIGVCGEHAGNPLSIDFINKINVDYIACSPYRVPTARLAAAHANLKLNYN